MQLTGIQATQKIEELKNEVEQLRKELAFSRRSWDQLLSLIDLANIIIIRWNTDGMITFVNDFALNFFGYSHEEMKGLNIIMIVPPGDSSGIDFRELVKRIVSEPGGYFRFEKENITKNGEHVSISWMNRAVTDETGRIVELLSLGVDMTERKKAEAKALSDTIEIEAILSCIADGVVVYNKEGRIIRSNAAADDILKLRETDKQLTLAERVPRRYRVFTEDGRQLTPDEMPAFRAAVYGETIKNIPLLIEVMGEPHWINMSAAPLIISDRHVGGVISLSEFTNKKEIENNLIRERELFQGIFNNIPVMLTIYDPDMRNFRFNDEFKKLTGWTEEDTAGGDFMEKIYPDPAQRNEVAEYMKSLEPGWKEMKMTARNGDIIDSSWANVILRNGLGIGIGMDIRQVKHSQEVLSKNEQRLRAIFNNVAIGIVEVDSDDRIVSMNERTCEILGYSPEELTGRTVSEITAPEYRPLSDDMNTRLHRGDFNVFDYEKRYLKRDGTPLWVHVTVSAVRNSEGKHVNSIGTIQDISARKRFEEELSESKQRLQVIFDKAAIGIAEVDADDRFIAVNDRICEILGYRREDLLGKSVPEITSSEDLPHSREMIRKLSNGELDRFDYEKRYLKGDGTRIWVQVTVSAVRDIHRNYLRTIRTVEDISEKKKIEMEIRQKNEELTRFIYTVSHDLRSPLVTIKSFTSFLKENIEKNDREAQEKDINYIQNAADRMGRLLDELLELSRIGRKDKPKTKTPLRTIAQAAIDAVAGRIEQKKIKIKFSGPRILLYGHSQRLVQLYQNLLDNSAKFIGDQKDPEIEVGSYADEKRNEIVLYVRDNGPGIDPRHHHKLFGLFEKLNDNQEGTGIGLALVKRIVEIHGGSIWFESGEGKGTTFFFTIDGTEVIN